MRLKDEVKLKSGKRLPKGHILSSIDNGHPYIKVKDMGSFKTKLNDKFEYLPDELVPKLANYTVKTNDVILSIVGTIGNVSIIDKSLDGANLTENCVKLITSENYLSSYLYYYLISTKGQNEISKGIVGSTQPKLPFYNIENIEIPNLCIEKQQHIVNTIGSIDDLIELNEKKIATLENVLMNNFIFFYSTKCNVEEKLGNICDCLLGGTPNTFKPEFWDGNINWINSGEINNFRICNPTRKITELGMNKSSTKLLPKGTVVLAITGSTLGQVSLLEINTCANQSVVGILENYNYGKEFIYPLIRYHINDLTSNRTGGAQSHINNDDIKNLSIRVPDKSEYLLYRERIEPIMKLQSNLIHKNEKLKKTKQTLLGKYFR